MSFHTLTIMLSLATAPAGAAAAPAANAPAVTAAPAESAPTAQPAAPPEPAPVPAPASAPPPAPAAADRPIVIVLPAPAAPDPAAPSPGGDIVVSARVPVPGDPLAQLNAKSFDTVQAVDRAVVGPVATGYKQGVPKPIRLGLRNFLRNLDEPVSFLNYLLQLKPKRAVKSLGRFAINSTIGVAGLVDVAKKKPFNLPYVPNGFANTFACYGIGPGPFLFLPLVGPITVRDLVGLGLDRAVLPAAVGSPLDKSYYAIPAGVIDSLNDRIEIDGQLKQIRDESPDPYVSARELYLKQRKAEVAAICPRKADKPDPALPPRPGKGAD